MKNRLLQMSVSLALAYMFASPSYADTSQPNKNDATPTSEGTIPLNHTSIPNTESIETEPAIVTAQKLKDARIDLSPKIGTTIYTIDQKMVGGLSQGVDTPLDEVLLHLPGVDKDSKASGALHVRDDHGNVQYRIDGVILPEAISGFGTSIDTRFIDKIDFATGALPAQYGLRTAGVVDIQTKEGLAKPGGQLGFMMGSHNTYQPSAQLFGTVGNFGYYISGSYLSNSLGIENPLPTRNANHDDTKQTKSFSDFSYFVDDNTRLGLMLGTYNGKFQIPTNPDQAIGFSLAGVSDTTTGFTALPSSQVNERQTEVNRFYVLSLQKTVDNLDYQISAFHQYSNLHFTPDPQGDLIFNGVASNSLRSNSANGLQLDASYKLNAANTLRFGGGYIRQLTKSINDVSVFPVDAAGNQTSTNPLTVTDNSSKVGQIASVYLQDEWRIDPKLTANYGLRFDHVDAFTNEQQLSPRLNAAYKLTDDTSLHAGYSRYFTPPPQELASQQSINLYTGTTNQAAVPISDTVKAERTNYYDVGVTQKVTSHLTLAADSYYKQIKNLVDEGQFGQALILSPFNYAQGYAQGLELSANYTNNNWSGFANFTYQKAQGKNIISSQSLFGSDELAYIADHYIYVDHDQTYTMSGGVSYRFGASQISGDAIFGSGLRATGTDSVPNGTSLPNYKVFNMAFTHSWKSTPIGDIEWRLSALNLFNETYLLRDGSGVGVGAPQYGARRTFFTGITTSF